MKLSEESFVFPPAGGAENEFEVSRGKARKPVAVQVGADGSRVKGS